MFDNLFNSNSLFSSSSENSDYSLLQKIFMWGIVSISALIITFIIYIISYCCYKKNKKNKYIKTKDLDLLFNNNIKISVNDNNDITNDSLIL